MNNYMGIILKAIEKGSIPMGSFLMPIIAHDDWCNSYKEYGSCNCNPDISVETEDGLIFLNEDGSVKEKI
jgi:hypothetical protein